MTLPKFLLGDHASYPDEVFIIHTEFPRLVLNLANDEVVWLEDIADEDNENLSEELVNVISLAEKFYDEQMDVFEKM
jgi:hypothetical protein